MKTKYYYLFGCDAVETFENDGIDELLYENAKGRTEYETYIFDTQIDNPTDLILKAQSYEKFIELTEYDFLRLNE